MAAKYLQVYVIRPVVRRPVESWFHALDGDEPQPYPVAQKDGNGNPKQYLPVCMQIQESRKEKDHPNALEYAGETDIFEVFNKRELCRKSAKE